MTTWWWFDAGDAKWFTEVVLKALRIACISRQPARPVLQTDSDGPRAEYSESLSGNLNSHGSSTT